MKKTILILITILSITSSCSKSDDAAPVAVTFNDIRGVWYFKTYTKEGVVKPFLNRYCLNDLNHRDNVEIFANKTVNRVYFFENCNSYNINDFIISLDENTKVLTSSIYPLNGTITKMAAGELTIKPSFNEVNSFYPEIYGSTEIVLTR